MDVRRARTPITPPPRAPPWRDHRAVRARRVTGAGFTSGERPYHRSVGHEERQLLIRATRCRRSFMSPRARRTGRVRPSSSDGPRRRQFVPPHIARESIAKAGNSDDPRQITRALHRHPRKARLVGDLLQPRLDARSAEEGSSSGSPPQRADPLGERSLRRARFDLSDLVARATARVGRRRRAASVPRSFTRARRPARKPRSLALVGQAARQRGERGARH